MVYEVIWTNKALDSYSRTMLYLEDAWTQKEINIFFTSVQRKLDAISRHPYAGSPVAKQTLTQYLPL